MEGLRFAEGASDLYTRDEWLDGAFPNLTVSTDGQVATLERDGEEILGPGERLGCTVDDIEPTGEVLGCEFCNGLPWPDDFTTDGSHGSHEKECPAVEKQGGNEWTVR